jgi:transcriptional regulator with XRE-family HTH domain
MAHKRFAGWVRSSRRTQAELAFLLDINQSTLWRWMHGDATPELEKAFRIQELTRGAIKAKDWISTRRAA